mgnify:CR=1 FL=1
MNHAVTAIIRSRIANTILGHFFLFLSILQFHIHVLVLGSLITAKFIDIMIKILIKIPDTHHLGNHDANNEIIC